MGKSQSKVAPQEGPIVDDMRKKYGPTSLEMLDVWVEKYRFPTGGSLSMEELRKLELRLKLEKEKITNWRRKDTQMIRDHERCLSCWKAEAEIRQRKQSRECVDSTVRRSTVVEEMGPDKTRIHTHMRSPGLRRRSSEGSEKRSTNKHEHTDAPNHLYLSLEGPRDPLLDLPVFPPAYLLPQAPPYNPAHASAGPALNRSQLKRTCRQQARAPSPCWHPNSPEQRGQQSRQSHQQLPQPQQLPPKTQSQRLRRSRPQLKKRSRQSKRRRFGEVEKERLKVSRTQTRLSPEVTLPFSAPRCQWSR